jgi:hypothetical protein
MDRGAALFAVLIVSHTKESNDDVFASHWVVLLCAMFSILAQASHNLLALATSYLSISNIGYICDNERCRQNNEILPVLYLNISI